MYKLPPAKKIAVANKDRGLDDNSNRCDDSTRKTPDNQTVVMGPHKNHLFQAAKEAATNGRSIPNQSEKSVACDFTPETVKSVSINPNVTTFVTGPHKNHLFPAAKEAATNGRSIPNQFEKSVACDFTTETVKSVSINPFLTPQLFGEAKLKINRCIQSIQENTQTQPETNQLKPVYVARSATPEIITSQVITSQAKLKPVDDVQCEPTEIIKSQIKLKPPNVAQCESHEIIESGIKLKQVDVAQREPTQIIKPQIQLKQVDVSQIIKPQIQLKQVDVSQIIKPQIQLKQVDVAHCDPTQIIKPQIQLKQKINVEPMLFDDDEVYQNDLCKFNLWSEKYRPKNLNQIVGNHEQISQIRNWFRRFKLKDNTIKKALLFSGCPGTSKTTVAHAVLHEFGYSVKEYNASDVRSKKLVEANLEKLIGMEQVDKHFKEGFRPFGIIMDEVDGMSSGDKGGMNQLIKIINPNRGKRSVRKEEKQKISERWIPPIICICNNNYDKKIMELKKDCLEIKFEKPTINELCLVIDNVVKNENLRVSEAAKKIVSELAQGDFRRLMFLLQNFSNIDKQEIDSNDIYEYYDIISKKCPDLNSYETTNKILNKFSPVEDILKLYETDKSLLPMMVHENYIEVIDSQNTQTDNKLINCLYSIDSIINGDIIEKTMYNTQSWYLHPIHGLSSCYIPSYYANVYHKLGHRGAKWTNTLGRFSLQRANIKNINLVMSMLNTGHTYNVDDIHLLSQVILYNLLDPNGNQEIGVQYLKNYNLIVKDIEKLIKMNKLSDKYKNLYKSRQKTTLTRLFGDISQKEMYTMTYNSGSGCVTSFSFSGDKVNAKHGKRKSSDSDTGSEGEQLDYDDNGDLEVEQLSEDENHIVIYETAKNNPTTIQETKRKYTRKTNHAAQATIMAMQEVRMKKIPILKKT